MKKFLVFILVLSMILGTGIISSAVEGDAPTGPSITFKKIVEGRGNPEETFEFTVGEGEVIEGSATANDVPVIEGFTITVNKEAGEGTVGVNLPTFFKVGRYEYTITETTPELPTAGMTYDGTARTLVVIVTNKDGGGFDYTVGMKTTDGKSDDFTVGNNTYNSGNLKVEKVLEGNLTDAEDEFEIKVTLTGPEGKDFKTDGIDWGDGVLPADGKSATYTLKGGDDFTILNIPVGVDYEVVEITGEDFSYEVTYNEEETESATGTMDENGSEVTITNYRNTDIETGISLDNLPYILTMVLALGGLVVFLARKRRIN